ncbi:MAG: TAT-variant-translocated molybdopterin oxidoreductase [Bdellovibrionota bacterium]
MKNENNIETTTEKIFWKSLDEKYQTEEFKAIAQKEFVTSPFATEDGTDGVARRDFLKLMGASIALASTACIKRPVDYIVPYAEHPPEITPGVANYYASSWTFQGETHGLVVKTREGRPIYLSGNKKHPINQNGISAIAQAQILSLYDPDRLQAPVKRNEDGSYSKITWDKLDEEVTAVLKGGPVVLLSSSLNSPSTETLISDFFQGFKGKHVVWDSLGNDDVVAGQKASYGNTVAPRYRLDQAKMIVSIDADFLGTWSSSTELSRQFAQGRKPGKDMNKLVSFESMMSLTGANSDTRIPIAPSQQLTVAMGLINELVNNQKVSRYAGDGAVSKAASQFANAAEEIGMEKELLSQIAKDLWANRGASVVLTGGITTRTAQSADLHAAVNFLNTILENDGRAVDGTAVTTAAGGSYQDMKNLIQEMNEGKVSTLIIHRANPAYALPKSSGFVEALKKVKTVIYAGSHLDETGKLANYVAPDHHHLENWGDSEVQKGVYSIQQPTIRPLYDTRSLELTLISWAYQLDAGPSRLRDPDSWLDYLKKNWQNNLQKTAGVGGGFEDFWLTFLKEGVIDTSSRGGRRTAPSTARQFLVGSLTKIQKPVTKDVELVLYSKIGHADGSFANIAWLQEFPDPVTKIVWDNYFNVSPKMAHDLKIKEGTVIEVEANGVKMKLPAHIQPGLNAKTIAVAVGFGRTDAGSVGSNIGKNAFEYVNLKGDVPVFSGQEAKVSVTGEKIELACTQGHHSMEGRQIVVQATLKDYLNNPGANIHRHKMLSLWGTHEYKGYKWAMVIDQNVCNGCSACVIACQSENNIPTVGKKYILQGREMHWLRIDRYYAGDEANPETVFQPMLCQHCDNAPCETVCPVLATTHSDEGLNQMTYNRCVGTRYCSNNCPYKVRRFNWFNYATPLKKPQTMALNPDVTVRSRGVMEKCTFCTQRIHEAKNTAKDQNRKVKDGDVVTACQEACATGAIIFGNVNDPESQVAKLFKDPRSYSVLEEVNAVPSVRYQTKVRNSDTVATAKHHSSDSAGHDSKGGGAH